MRASKWKILHLKKDIEELEKLVKIAEEQGNNINLNLVYMIIDSEK